MLWSPSGRRTAALAAGARLIARGAIEGSFFPLVAAGCEAAIRGAEAVVIAVPGYAHRYVLDRVAPHLRGDQVVIYSSHMSFGALYLAHLLAARGAVVPIVALGTTLVTGRQSGPAEITVGSVRAKLDAAVLPHHAAHALAVCRTLFGDRFVARDGLLAIALSNLNPQNHWRSRCAT